MLNEFLKKEAPIQGLTGLGGGVPSRLLTLASGEVTYVDDVFSIDLYWGTGGNRSIVNNIDLAGEGGLVIIRRRESSDAPVWHYEPNKYLISSYADEHTTNVSNSLTSYNSNGFSLGSRSTVNAGGGNFVAYTFRKCPGFFDMVQYTGNGTGGRTVSHNLGSVPGVVIVKNLTTGSSNWQTHFTARGTNKNFPLNNTGTESTDARFIRSADATTITLGDDWDTNRNDDTYIAFIFAHNDASFGDDGDEAIIKCGYMASAGSELSLGFEPELLFTTTTGGQDRHFYDRSRGFATLNDTQTQPAVFLNKNNAESKSDNVRVSNTGFYNGFANNLLYMAIARSHKKPEAATDVFNVLVNGSAQMVTTGFKSGGLDLIIFHYMGGGQAYWIDRNRGLFSQDGTTFSGHQKYLTSATQAADGTDTGTIGVRGFSRDDQFYQSSAYETSISVFKRAKGFFDIATYVGNGVQGRNVTHNLGVTPELMIVKNRDTTNDYWATYVSGVTYQSVHGNDPDNYGNNPPTLKLNSTFAANFSMSGTWDHTHPTATTFRVGDTGSTNGNGEKLVAYLFASLDGISKVGSYAGTGNNIDVDCGFTNGARFVMIKRIDSTVSGTADWFYWTTAMGINSGNDTFLKMNTNASKNTSNDYIDPLNAGFTITSSAPSSMNASGGTYVFLAIA